MWKSKNAAGICAENEHIEKHGLPLPNLRQF
ncbi:type II toxin-antitoxin system CcdA family antitoxin [Rhizobium tarimense]|nr:type II toxin-antitoxin system CcdA family antitoxin [Pseudorhizobium tarimense]